jgi:hypothetical protein
MTFSRKYSLNLSEFTPSYFQNIYQMQLCNGIKKYYLKEGQKYPAPNAWGAISA